MEEGKRAIVTAVGGAQFRIDDNGMFPVVVSPKGRRLTQGIAGDDGKWTNVVPDALNTVVNYGINGAPADASKAVSATGTAVTSTVKSGVKSVKKLFG
jgi:hypothetical protein